MAARRERISASIDEIIDRLGRGEPKDGDLEALKALAELEGKAGPDENPKDARLKAIEQRLGHIEMSLGMKTGAAPRPALRMNLGR